MAEKVNYRKITMSGMMWKFLEQLGTKMVAFVLSVVLARLLYPEDYGVIALTSIFITICDTFVSSGFTTSLIQKKDTDELDYSSVFYTSMARAIILYAILFVSAPAISVWLETPVLCDVLRVLGLRLPIGAFGSVQQAYATKNYMFKKFFFATLCGSLVSGIIGIVLAYNGFGVWALVAHNLIEIVINKFTLYFVTKWRPHLCYSWQRTKALFGYGWKILATNLFETICAEANSLAIGKKYSSEDLAYSSKGSSLPKLIGQFAINPIRSVLMPVLSAKQDDKNILHTVSNCVSAACYLMFPVMCGLAIVAPTLIPLLYTSKWNGCIIFMQLMCMYYAIHPLLSINSVMIQARGHSSLVLIISVIVKCLGLILLFIALQFGVFWIVLSQVVTLLLQYLILAIPNGKIYGYGLGKQLKDMIPYLLLTALMGVIVYLFNFLTIHPYLILALQVVTGVVIYVSISIIFKIPAFTYLLNTLKSLLSRNKKTADSQSTASTEDTQQPSQEE